MIKTLGQQQSCPKQLPLAMFLAVEPAFTSFEISEEALKKDLSYNPMLQINNASAISMVLDSTSTSVETSTNTGSFATDSDSDTKGDEYH